MSNVNDEFVPRGRAADAVDQDWARALAAKMGVVRAAKTIGCSRSSLANVIGGLSVYPGTLALIREARTRTHVAA